MKKLILFIGTLALAPLMQAGTQYHTFSLFLAAASIPLLIILIDPLPLLLAIGSFLILDMYSTLPQGAMLLMFIIPFATRWLWNNVSADLTWKFFFFVLVTITLQIAALAGISLLGGPLSLTALPWGILALQAGITTIGTCILAFITHEYSS